jgi:hypothetical protein
MTALTAATGQHSERTRPGWAGMIWVAWRQHRAALAGVAGLLGACALALGITGLQMQSAHAALVRGGCPLLGAAYTSRCGRLETGYYHAGYPLTSNVSLVNIGLWALPALIGMFVAAPLLAREYEAGTFQFAWTQTAGRTRWLVAKLALLVVILTAASGAFGVLLSWWLSLVDPLSGGSRWQPGGFGSTGVTFAAWTLLGFAAGVFAGALIRRTVPAMAAVGGCIAALLLVTYKRLDTLLVSVSPLVRPVTLLNTAAYQPGSPPPTFLLGMAVNVSTPPGSWPLRAWVTGAGGRAPGGSAVQHFLSLSPSAGDRWVATNHLTVWAAYQPASRFWLFQAAEGGACLLLALILVAATVWLVRHRTT